MPQDPDKLSRNGSQSEEFGYGRTGSKIKLIDENRKKNPDRFRDRSPLDHPARSDQRKYSRVSQNEEVDSRRGGSGKKSIEENIDRAPHGPFNKGDQRQAQTVSQNEEVASRRGRSDKKSIEENIDRAPRGPFNKGDQSQAQTVTTQLTPYIGLQNPGNTCYLNALLQCLFLTPEFRQKFSSEVNQVAPVYSAVERIFCALDKRNPGMNSFKVNEYLELPSNKQQDVPEVFQLLLNKLDSETTDGSHFKEVFKATFVNLTECTKCETKDGFKNGTGIVILPFAVLPKENIEEQWSVAKALKQFLHEDTMAGENQIYCSTCRMKTDTKLRQTFTNLPQILVVQLKRFEYNFFLNTFVKLDNTISVNMTLKVPCETAEHSENKVYELFAICDHQGGIYGGHYTALIKPKGSDKWHRFNDSIVKTEDIQQKTEKKSTSNDDLDLHSDTAYLLMYRKRSDGAPKKDKGPPLDASHNPPEPKDKRGDEQQALKKPAGEGEQGQPIQCSANHEDRALLPKESPDRRGRPKAISHDSTDHSSHQNIGDHRRNTKNGEWIESHKEQRSINKESRLMLQHPEKNIDTNLPAETEHSRANENRCQQFKNAILSCFQSCFRPCTLP